MIDPPPVGSGDFTLTVAPESQDAQITQLLGWTTGIPGAQVTVTPTEAGAPSQSLLTGATGSALIPQLPSGRYLVTVRRPFTSQELGQLAAQTDAVGFAGSSAIEVSSTHKAGSVLLPASYPRSLVISEWWFRERNIPGSGTYHFGGFLELYNNGDSTLFLDGVLIAQPWTQLVNWPGFPCNLTEGYRNDPAGLWSKLIAAFPGSGRDYPLPPGANVVVATDAIDHRNVFPGMLDLRGAHFEFFGTADVDNPAVPNMVDIGTQSPPLGHGMIFPSPLEVLAGVGAAVPRSSLPKGKDPDRGDDALLLPRDKVMDVFATANTYLLNQQPPLQLCTEMLTPALDREHGFFLHAGDTDWQVSVSRKVLARASNGRLILQHTRTSANDFERTTPSPGVVKEQ